MPAEPQTGRVHVAATQINGGGADVPSSEQKTVVERVSTSDDGLDLYYGYVLYDPVYMSREHEARVVLRCVTDDAPRYDYDCNVGLPGSSPASRAKAYSRPATRTRQGRTTESP